VDRGDVTAVQDAPGAVVIGGARPVVIIGIPHAVVVDSEDALLVTTRAAAQQVKNASKMVEQQRL